MPLITVSISLPSYFSFSIFPVFAFLFILFHIFSIKTSVLSFVFPPFIFLNFPHTLTLSFLLHFTTPFHLEPLPTYSFFPTYLSFSYCPLHFILSFSLPSLSFLSSFLYLLFSPFASFLLAFCFLLSLFLVFHVNYSSIYFHILLLSLRIPFF